jgi:hypothetical protein
MSSSLPTLSRVNPRLARPKSATRQQATPQGRTKNAAKEGFQHSWGHDQFIKQRKVARSLLVARAEWEGVSLPPQQTLRKPRQPDPRIAEQERELATQRLKISSLEDMLLLQQRGVDGTGSGEVHSTVDSKHPYLAARSQQIWKVSKQNSLELALYFDQRTVIAEGDEIIVFKTHPVRHPDTQDFVLAQDNIYCRFGPDTAWAGTEGTSYHVVNCNTNRKNRGTSTIYVAFITKKPVGPNVDHQKPWGFRLTVLPATSKGELRAELELQDRKAENLADKARFKQEMSDANSAIMDSKEETRRVEDLLDIASRQLEEAAVSKAANDECHRLELEQANAATVVALLEVEQLRRKMVEQHEKDEQEKTLQVAKAKMLVRQRGAMALATIQAERDRALSALEAKMKTKIDALEIQRHNMEDALTHVQEETRLEHGALEEARMKEAEALSNARRQRWKMGAYKAEERHKKEQLKEARLEALNAKRHEQQSHSEMAAGLHVIFQEYKSAKLHIEEITLSAKVDRARMEQEAELLKLDYERCVDDARKVKPLQKQVRDLEDKLYASTRAALRKSAGSKDFDESLEIERKARRQAEHDLESKTCALQLQKEHELKTAALAKEIEDELRRHVQDLLTELAEKEGDFQKVLTEIEHAESRPASIGDGIEPEHAEVRGRGAGS